MASPTASLFLWHGQGLYIGSGQFSTRHRHYAMQIGISLDENPIRIRADTAAMYKSVYGFIAPPNVPHQVDSAGVCSAFLWIESEQVSERILRGQAERDAPLPLAAERLRAVIARLAPLAAQAVGCDEATAAFEDTVQAIASEDTASPALDPRILNVLRSIRQEQFTGDPRPIPRIAAAVHLSASRLRHLFRQQLGLPLQRYLLWQRLLRALEFATVNEASLTHAAHAAGFADSAHLAREFRATFGLKPSDIWKNQLSIRIIPCLNPALHRRPDD